MSSIYNGYLGGHEWVTHTDLGALKYLKDTFGVQTMLDLGCGPGGQIEVAKSIGLIAEGVDGDPRVIEPAKEKGILIHECDFTKNTFSDKQYDLVWSTEFVEHVEESYLPNFMPTFQCGSYIFMTFAPPGKAGNHHVNCRDAKYWVDKFLEYGIIHDENVTEEVKKHSTMEREFVQNNGMFFYRK